MSQELKVVACKGSKRSSGHDKTQRGDMKDWGQKQI